MATQAHLLAGRRDSAKVFAERLLRRVPSWRVAAGLLHGLLGARDTARLVLREVQSGPPRGDHHTQTAMVALGLGDTALALTSLEQATDAGDAWPTWLSLSERPYDQIRSSARFATLVARVGLDARIFTSPGGGRPQ